MYPHENIMHRASTHAERRLAFLEARMQWQRRVTALLILLSGTAAGMAAAGWYLYG